MLLQKYSFGTGDRFGLQGDAQLEAVRKAAGRGVEIAIVWNKSHREHTIVGTRPADVRREADRAVAAAGWSGGYYVDADHIGLETVDGYLEASDFFTLDVADYIGKKADEAEIDAYVARLAPYTGGFAVPGMADPIRVDRERLRQIAEKYLFAVAKAGEIYRRIAAAKGAGTFVTEVSLDETDEPQTPEEIFFILAAIAAASIPAQTIAPKFSGRFNKGVDYQGDVAEFTREFGDNIQVIRKAVAAFGLPANLKLSVHSGSDKFSLYPKIRAALAATGAGVHVKTAGTTWLEEMIGLAESGGSALSLAKSIYGKAYGRFDELCGPYRTVIDIDRAGLPAPAEVDGWDGGRLARALRHDQACGDYNSDIRQLLHVAYKVAAELGDVYLQAVRDNRLVIAEHVCGNLYDKHLVPLFLHP